MARFLLWPSNIISRVEALPDVQPRVEPRMGSFEFYLSPRRLPGRDQRTGCSRATPLATHSGARASRAAGEKLRRGAGSRDGGMGGRFAICSENNPTIQPERLANKGYG